MAPNKGLLLEHPLQGTTRDTVECLLQVHKTREPVGQTPMNPRVPCRGCRGGPVFHSQDENHTATPEAEVRLSVTLCSPIPWRRPYQGGKAYAPSCEGGPPPQSASPEELSPTAMQC
ncbi:hypothetical protein ILYODFUR_003351 [Ilyodon furcidens]|uniref:Uncharacterized protein n=1 Tax=Ilyodon furcidens TaxID=33524 RepID=A0ABV0SJV3_9TELE